MNNQLKTLDQNIVVDFFTDTGKDTLQYLKIGGILIFLGAGVYLLDKIHYFSKIKSSREYQIGTGIAILTVIIGGITVKKKGSKGNKYTQDKLNKERIKKEMEIIDAIKHKSLSNIIANLKDYRINPELFVKNAGYSSMYLFVRDTILPMITNDTASLEVEKLINNTLWGQGLNTYEKTLLLQQIKCAYKRKIVTPVICP